MIFRVKFGVNDDTNKVSAELEVIAVALINTT